MVPRNENPTVYSTETGRICPQCGRPIAGCICKKQRSAHSHEGVPDRRPPVPKDGILRVSIESKGRGGKTVSLVNGLEINDNELKNLASELKRICGAGGAIKDRIIEIQGDHRDTLVEALKKLGYKAKRV